jgi:hypothetical protein
MAMFSEMLQTGCRTVAGDESNSGTDFMSATPFPGMDPYLEHPVLWESFHARMIVAMANQLQPRLDPRYIASVEERVFVEGPQRRIPDVWIQRDERIPQQPESVMTDNQADTAVLVEIDDLELHETRIEILDAYNGMKLVALIELVSPTNKASGPGRESYLAKQRETLDRNCHLIEIDLLRGGRHALSLPEWRVRSLEPYDSLCCISRWPHRNRFEMYPRRLQDRLPGVGIPLADPDPDVKLDLQAAFEQVYLEGRYVRRIRYDEACDPSLSDANQAWANVCLATFRQEYPGMLKE